MQPIKNERNSSLYSAQTVEISFNLKQCTVFHNKFGCYSFDLKYGNQSKRSPTINILKEKVNLDVILAFKDVPFDGDDIQISLYNQMLVRNKQNDVLISQQILKLSSFNSSKVQNSADQYLTFEQDGQLKAQVKYMLKVSDLKDNEDFEEVPRRFMNLLKEWMRDQFLKQIIDKVDNEDKEEKLKKLKQQQEELLKKKREEEEARRKQQEEEENERIRVEKEKKLEQLKKLKQLKDEREQREREKLKKEEQEKEQQRLLKLQQIDKQKKKELEEQKKKQKQVEENELKEYEDEEFEEEHDSKNKKISQKPLQSENTNKLNKRSSNNEEIQEELVEETEDLYKQQKTPINRSRSNHFSMKKIKSKQINSSHLESYYSIGAPSRDNSMEKSFLDKSGMKLRSATKLDKRNYMTLLKQWMTKFLKKIIRSTSFSNQLNLYTSSFYIFGDETFPYILIFDPFSQQLDRISQPKSLTMYRYSQAIALPNGSIFICGGVNCKLNNILPLCQLYDPFLNKGYPLPSMNYARYTHSAIYFHDFVYVLGGRTYGSGEQSILNTFERFNLKTNKWEKLANLQDGRCTCSLIGLSDKRYLYLVGGFSPKGRLNQIERYNIQENSWSMLNIKLPLAVEAGIAFQVSSCSSDSFYFMFGRGEEDRNEQIFKIQINLQSNGENRIDSIGKVKKSRVLPSYFIDDDEKLYVFGGDENAWERYEIPSFFSKFGKKNNIDILPSDMKMYCSARSYIEKPHRPSMNGQKEAFYLHIVVFDLDLSVKQFKSSKENINSKSNKLQLQKPISSQSCQLINSNYLFIYGGEYAQQNVNPSPMVKENSKAKLPQKQVQEQKVQPQNQNGTKLSKESYIFSLNTQQILQLSPSIYAKKNTTSFYINQMIYSFGGQQISEVDGSSLEASKTVERFHLKQNKWQRMADLQLGVSLSTAFIYDKVIYLLGGINSQNVYNNQVLKYDLQYDYSITSKHTLPIEFKHTIQFYAADSSPTQFILLFSASFKQQGVYNLLTGEFNAIELVSQQAYVNDEKRVLRVSQEQEMISFILPQKIDIFRGSVDFNSMEKGNLPKMELTKIKEIGLQGGKQPQNVQKEQVVPIRNIFMTKFVDRRMEFYDFIEFNENRRVLRTQSASNGQNINSASNLDDASSNGLQVLPSQVLSNSSITCMYEDNQGNVKLVKQELSSGYEENTVLFNTNNQTESCKIERKSVMTYISDSQRLILTGGVDGSVTKGNIIEVNLSKKKIQKIQEMITPRYNHCQIIVGHYLYMIGGCNIIQGSTISTNNSPSLQKLQQFSNITKSQSSSKVFDKQSQILQKNQSEKAQTANTTATGSISSIVIKNEKQPSAKNSKINSASSTNISKSNKYSLNKKLTSAKDNSSNKQQQKQACESIELIPSDDEGVDQSKSIVENQKEELFFSQQSSVHQQHNRSNYLQSALNRGQNSNLLSFLKKVERLNLRTNEIEQISDMPTNLMNASCCEIKGVIYVVGGKDSQATCIDTIYKYEIHSNIWTISQCKLWQPLHSLSCVAVGFNQIIAFGGISQVDHSVKDIQVLDIKTGSTKKIAASSVDNLAPLLFTHSSQHTLVGKDIYLFDKNHIQCVDVVSNFDSYLVKEISPLESIKYLKDAKQIYGVFSNKILDNSALSIQSHYSAKQYDTFTIIGNDKNPISIQYDMRMLKFKVTEQPKNFQLCQSSSSCCIETDNTILLSGGVESEQISPYLSVYKNYQFSQLKQAQLNVPRFLHASVYHQNKVYFIGGKSYSNKMQKSQAPNSSSSTASSNSPNTSYNSEDKQTKYACISECEVLDLANYKVTKIAQLNFPRSNFSAVVLMDCIYVFGGFGGDKRFRSIERFIVGENKWEVVDCYLNSDLDNFQLCKISPFEVLIVGGKENGTNSSKIFIFNSKFHTLSLANIKLTHDFSAFKCAVYSEDLFVFGSSQNQAVVVSYNLKNCYEDTKLPIVQQLSQLDISWSSVLTKSY